MEQRAPAAKPYIALLQLEGDWKRLIDDIVDFIANKLKDPWQLQGPIYEQALRLVWFELAIDGSNNQDELQRWLVSLRENPRQYKSIFGFTKGHDGGLRASVGRDHQRIAQDRLFFLLPWGRRVNKVTPMGTKNGRVPH